MLDSEITRSTSVRVLTACPHEDLTHLMDIIADLRRENDNRQRISSTWSYCMGCPTLMRNDASLL